MEYECQHFSAFAWRVILGNSIYKSNCVVSVHNKKQQEEGPEIHGNLYLLGISSDRAVDTACICFAHTDGKRLHLWEKLKR